MKYFFAIKCQMHLIFRAFSHAHMKKVHCKIKAFKNTKWKCVKHMTIFYHHRTDNLL